MRSYTNAEKLIGRDPNSVLVLPRADDTEGQRALYAKLGMPDSPDKYSFDTPDDLPLDEGYMNWAKGAFHKAGLSDAQVKALSAEHNSYIREALAQESKDYEANVSAEANALKREWGAGADRMFSRAQHAASKLGFTDAMIDGIEQSVGYAATIKLFAELGGKLSEDGFVSPEGKAAGFGAMLTPQEAKAQWDQFKMDPNNVAALTNKDHPGHKAAKQKQNDLFGVMYPEG